MASEDCQPKANLFYMVRPCLTQKLETTAASESSSLQDRPSVQEPINAENSLFKSFLVLFVEILTQVGKIRTTEFLYYMKNFNLIWELL